MSLPVGAQYAAPLPHGRTARRLTWEHLPPDVRRLIEGRAGSTVIDAASQDSGFTPGFASVLTFDDSSRLFVKAASRVAQRPVAESYAREAQVLRRLGDLVPAPALRWAETGDWVVLAIEAPDHRPPARPWTPADLTRCLDLTEDIARRVNDVTSALTADLGLRPVHRDLPGLLTGWRSVATLEPDWPHLEDAASLAATYAYLPDADAIVHADLRDDNILLLHDGGALACDWTWLGLGPAWVDLLTLCVAAHGDGLAVADELGSRELTRDVDPDHLDAWLACLAGFMLEARERPSPMNSPYLQTHSFWYAEAAWGLLAERRGWA